MAASSSLSSNNSSVRTGNWRSETTWMIRMKNQISLKQHYSHQKNTSTLRPSPIHHSPSFDKNHTLRSSIASLLRVIPSTPFAYQSPSSRDGNNPADVPNNRTASSSTFPHCKLRLTPFTNSHQPVKERLSTCWTRERTCLPRSMNRMGIGRLPSNRPTPDSNSLPAFPRD